MKRKLLVATLILIIAGAAVFLIGFIVNDSAPSPLFTAEEQTIVIEEPFTDIAIDAGSCNINIEKTDGQARVETKLCGALACEITAEHGVLTIHADEYMHFGLHLFSDEITVYLPDGKCGRADIGLTSGNVTLDNISVGGDLTLSLTSGNARLTSVSCEGKLTADTSSGSITLDSVTVPVSVELIASSGSVKIKDTTCAHLTAGASSGSITLDGVTVAVGVELTASSGSLKIKDTFCAHLTAKTSSGSIKLDLCGAESMELTASSGDISGTIAGSRIFECSTGSGSIHVPDTIEGGLCKIRTGSGDIHIEIAK